MKQELLFIIAKYNCFFNKNVMTLIGRGQVSLTRAHLSLAAVPTFSVF